MLCVDPPQIPAMAVEMPGSTDISGLNLQFGALQFGSEPVVPEYDSTPATTTPANQVQNSLYTSPSRFVFCFFGGWGGFFETKLPFLTTSYLIHHKGLFFGHHWQSAQLTMRENHCLLEYKFVLSTWLQLAASQLPLSSTPLSPSPAKWTFTIRGPPRRDATLRQSPRPLRRTYRPR